VYLMEELFSVLKTASPDVTNEVADSLVKRTRDAKPFVKTKTLKVIRVRPPTDGCRSCWGRPGQQARGVWRGADGGALGNATTPLSRRLHVSAFPHTIE
jgi:hypothetical protein